MPATLTDLHTGHQPIQSWTREEPLFTGNQVIEAYLKGKQEGRTEVEIALNHLFNRNLEKAKSLTENLYSILRNMRIDVSVIHLKADSATAFTSLFVVSLEDYVGDKILDAISRGLEIQARESDESFSIDFSFTHNSPTLNVKAIISDGYFLRYGSI
jgi:hypothetical protein